MQKFLLKIAYDGSCYHGWQNQPNGISVQEVLENALTKIAKTNISLVASGRTDTGVHALAQFAHLYFPLNMTPQQIRLALRTKLPDSIRVTEVHLIQEELHARYSAFQRSYKYILTRAKNPFNRLYKSFVPYQKLDLEIMQKAIPYLLGENDFASFCKPNPQIPNTVCNLKQFDLITQDNDIIFYITANRFLHNMVRRLVGTLISFSHNNYEPQLMREILEAKIGNQNIIFTAPPNGLYLLDVKYPDLDKLILESSIEEI
ncbi:tRNA pseudouridine(38-40) synthase TruA [bacterium]|nr:tRNA pseudouridine(38-40) synthase TruA [bacterium]